MVLKLLLFLTVEPLLLLLPPLANDLPGDLLPNTIAELNLLEASLFDLLIAKFLLFTNFIYVFMKL